MQRQKKIFVGMAIIFAGLLLYASYDIGSRTTFPGSKGQLRERLNKQYGPDDARWDSLELDSAARKGRL